MLLKFNKPFRKKRISIHSRRITKREVFSGGRLLRVFRVEKIRTRGTGIRRTTSTGIPGGEKGQENRRIGLEAVVISPGLRKRRESNVGGVKQRQRPRPVRTRFSLVLTNDRTYCKGEDVLYLV